MAKPLGLTKTARRNLDSWTNLKAYFNEYGLNKSWDDIKAFKFRSDECYVLLVVEDGAPGEDRYSVIDIAATGVDTGWEMQNDGSEGITAAQWAKVYIPEACDWYEFRGQSDAE